MLRQLFRSGLGFTVSQLFYGKSEFKETELEQVHSG